MTTPRSFWAVLLALDAILAPLVAVALVTAVLWGTRFEAASAGFFAGILVMKVASDYGFWLRHRR